MQDRQSDVKWYHSISDCPKTGFLPVPAAGSVIHSVLMCQNMLEVDAL